MSEQTGVRSACEPCHRRKNRCMVAATGGPCHNCQARKTKCYFLPRFRSGRPSTKTKLLNTEPGRKPSGNRSDSIYDENHAFIDDIDPVSYAVATSGSDATLPWSWDDSISPNHYSSQPHLICPTEPNFIMPATSFTGGITMQSTMTERQSPHINPSDYQTVPINEPLRSLHTHMSGSAWLSRPYLSSDREAGERMFTTLLEQCTKIQAHITALSQSAPLLPLTYSSTTNTVSSVASSIELSRLLEDIDTACTFILGVYGSSKSPTTSTSTRNSSDHALLALTNVVIIKIFQLYNMVFDYNLLSNHGLNDILHYKRLDVNITQLQIVIAKLRELMQESHSLETHIAMTASTIEQKLKLLSW